MCCKLSATQGPGGRGPRASPEPCSPLTRSHSPHPTFISNPLLSFELQVQNFSSADSPGCPPNLSPVGQHGQEHRHRLCAQAVRLAALPGSFSSQLHLSPAPSNRQVTRCPFGLCPVRSPPVLPRCLVSPSSFLPPCVLLPTVLSQRSCDRLMGSCIPP